MKGNWRDGFGSRLYGVLEQQGVGPFLAACTQVLNVNTHGDNALRAQIVGEMCEVVITGMTGKYLKTTGREGRVYHSVVLKDLGNLDSNFRTELDIVLATPYFILTTECKSYRGNIELVGKGSISRNGKQTDVYKQSLGHYRKLVQYGEQMVLPAAKVGRPPIFANAFLFSNAAIEDRRGEEERKAFRFLTTSTLLKYYDAMYSRYTRRVFDEAKMERVFSVCESSETLHRQHKNYLGY